MRWYQSHILRICRNIVPAVLFISLFVACSEKEEDNRKVTAEVYGEKLYEEEVVNALQGVPQEAYEHQREAYINAWIERTIFAQLAKRNIKDIKSRIKPQIEEYEASLMRFEYEQSLIKSNLDTIVSSKEIQAYYKKNLKDFELSDYLVRLIFIKASKDADKVNEVNYWFRSNDSIELVKLDEWATKEATHYYKDDGSWLYFNDVKKLLPQEMVYNENYFIVNKLARKYEDEEFVYFFRILDFRTGVSPLEFERENIKSRIIQMRINNLRKSIREEIINEAYKNNSIKRY